MTSIKDHVVHLLIQKIESASSSVLEEGEPGLSLLEVLGISDWSSIFYLSYRSSTKDIDKIRTLSLSLSYIVEANDVKLKKAKPNARRIAHALCNKEAHPIEDLNLLGQPPV